MSPRTAWPWATWCPGEAPARRRPGPDESSSSAGRLVQARWPSGPIRRCRPSGAGPRCSSRTPLRTRVSFETAAKRLSADVISFAAGSSSVKKGESLRDTVETIEAMGIDAVIVRHSSSGAPFQVANWVTNSSVINAGDGWHEHPTQALLDLYTVRQVVGDESMDCFDGLQVAIVGDIRHSRVARLQVAAHKGTGCRPWWLRPRSCPSLEGWPIAGTSHELDDVLVKAAVVSAAPCPGREGEPACPQPARVHRRVRAHPAAGGAAPARGDGSPSRAHGAGGGDRLGGRRPCSATTRQVSNGWPYAWPCCSCCWVKDRRHPRPGP